MNSKVTASLRAPEGFNLAVAMSDEPELYLKFGGHPGAAGFSANSENLELIKQSLSHNLARQIKSKSISKSYVSSDIKESIPKQFQNLIGRKSVLSCNVPDLNRDFLSEILELDPFGQHFPMPELLFVLRPQELTNSKFFGNENQHFKVFIGVDNLEMVFFNLEMQSKNLINDFLKQQKESLWCLAKASQNVWNNKVSINLIGIDLA